MLTLLLPVILVGPLDDHGLGQENSIGVWDDMAGSIDLTEM